MSYALMTSICLGCKNLFSYNPHRVPSVVIDGVKEPVCRACIARVNPKREANGLDPFSIHPDAYEPIHESEL